MSDLQEQLEALREKIHSGKATDEDNVEFRRLQDEVANERQASRVKREAEEKAASNGEGVATPGTVATGTAVNQGVDS